MTVSFADLATEIRRFDPTKGIGDNATPPASWYTDARFLELERETVFGNNWLPAGRLDQVQEPGDYFTCTYLRKPIIVTRDTEGVLRAFYNVCAHHGTRVCDGAGKLEGFTCPYHGWRYDLTGKLRAAPRAGRIEELAHKNLNLKPLPVKAWGPLVWIWLGAEDPPDMEQRMALLEARNHQLRFDGLQFVAQVVYTMDCNWKVFIDNYLDGGYHVPHMHKALAGDLKFDQYHSHIGDVFSIQSCPAATQEDTRLGDAADYTWIYPNLTLNRYGPWLDTNLVLPNGTHRCTVIFDYYHQGPVADDVLQTALAESDQVQQEDDAVCRRVQEGLESGVYDRGVYAPRYEQPMYHFHQLLAADFRSAQT